MVMCLKLYPAVVALISNTLLMFIRKKNSSSDHTPTASCLSHISEHFSSQLVHRPRREVHGNLVVQTTFACPQTKQWNCIENYKSPTIICTVTCLQIFSNISFLAYHLHDSRVVVCWKRNFWKTLYREELHFFHVLCVKCRDDSNSILQTSYVRWYLLFKTIVFILKKCFHYCSS